MEAKACKKLEAAGYAGATSGRERPRYDPPGKLADMILLDGGSVANITALRNVSTVIKNGKSFLHKGGGKSTTHRRW